MSPAMLADQRQLRQRPHRPIRAQHRIDQIEHGIGPRGHAPIQLLPQRRQVPERTSTAGVVHTIH
ncbi:hypothetical protein K7711_38240 [Nocardia sp. CA2R105]|uniref:hypothetical protein n=1 Tax=Nocardia coffeae TaxID=2873381 RepID=UPI001CA63E9A|nr:hypothetical protein [Nocardia coffeae]MBY8862364.1 hypothetical protein [Nocardia coffeae]